MLKKFIAITEITILLLMLYVLIRMKETDSLQTSLRSLALILINGFALIFLSLEDYDDEQDN